MSQYKRRRQPVNPYSKMSMGELLQRFHRHATENFGNMEFHPPDTGSEEEIIEYYARKIELEHEKWADKYRKALGLDDETPKDKNA